MKMILQRFIIKVFNVMLTFMLMAAPIAALVYSSQPLEEAGSRVDAALSSSYQELIEEHSDWYDTDLNKWYAEVSGQPTTIDIVDAQLFK